MLTSLPEPALQQSLQMSRGSFAILFTRPIAGTLMAAAALSMVLPLLPGLRRTREKLEAMAPPLG